MDEYLAIIKIFAGNFAIRGWAFCQGQLMSIAQNTAVFSLLGTTYGGDGQTTFALPDLRGRAPIGTGQGPGLSQYVLGQTAGSEVVTLLTNNMPMHTHNMYASNAAGTTAAPDGAFLAKGPSTGSGPNATQLKTYAAASNTTLNASTVGISGGSQPFTIMQPYLAINYIICLEGIFPSRN